MDNNFTMIEEAIAFYARDILNAAIDRIGTNLRLQIGDSIVMF